MVSRHVVTLANSIIGVSVLAMPFCFKQCGIILATLMLMMGAILTRMVCYFLLKAATITRRRTYELLAYHTFGQAGKFMVEISIIGFLIGTMIAFMVVMGDLGPEILSEVFAVENNSSLRTIIMTALSLFVALPLGLLRNMDSLSSVSTASVLFYVFLVCKILSDGMGSLWSGSYLDKIDYWRPAGVLQCIPIFSMALSCQTQIFGIYDSLPDPSLQKMNEVVKKAINVCTFFYFCVGFFGYIAFCTQNFGGNILLSFGPSWSTQLIKMCFLMSIVFSCPLVIFPCRASLHSLIFRRVHMHHNIHDISTNYIPDSRLKLLTVVIVAFTLIVGLIIPNIELVLGLVGSTTGSVICIIFPSIMFIRVTSKNTTEKLLAQTVFFVGVLIMVLTTYVTLYAVEKSQVSDPSSLDQFRMSELPLPIINEAPKIEVTIKSKENLRGDSLNLIHAEFEPKVPLKMISTKEEKKKDMSDAALPKPSPVPDRIISSPLNSMNKSSLLNQVPKDLKLLNEREMKQPAVQTDELQNQIPIADDPPVAVVKDSIVAPVAVRNVESKKRRIDDGDKPPPADLVRDNERKEQPVEPVPNVEPKSAVVPPPQEHIPVDNDVKIQEQPKDPKIETPRETRGAAKEESSGKDFVEKIKAEDFLKKLEQHQENQKKLLEEQKEILAELKQHHAADIVRDGAVNERNANVNKNDIISPVKQMKQIPEEKAKEPENVEKISEHVESKKLTGELLQKLEEGLNKEIKQIEEQPKVKIELPIQIQPKVAENNLQHKAKEDNSEIIQPQRVAVESGKEAAAVKKSVLEVLPPSDNLAQAKKQPIVEEEKEPAKSIVSKAPVIETVESGQGQKVVSDKVKVAEVDEKTNVQVQKKAEREM